MELCKYVLTKLDARQGYECEVACRGYQPQFQFTVTAIIDSDTSTVLRIQGVVYVTLHTHTHGYSVIENRAHRIATVHEVRWNCLHFHQ